MTMTGSALEFDGKPSAALLPGYVDLAVVVPTYRERENVPEFLARLERALEGIRWEAIFVDDDSPDGTARLLLEYAGTDPRIRLLHRIGRRGLSSACIEGMLSTSARAVAVMDADMQHDETILPRMFDLLRAQGLDLVVATRNAQGGSMGTFCPSRVRLSNLGRSIGQTICKCPLSDPMSGFFIVDRRFFLSVARNLHGGGFKLLVDMLSSAQSPVRFAEVGYNFRDRRHGESKLDLNVAIEYLLLVVNKLTRGLIPIRVASFSLIGIAGIATHLLCLSVLLLAFHWRFVEAQVAATFVAMTENFFLNNIVTWHDRSLRGLRMFTGLATFYLACSFGAWSNALVARALFDAGVPWYLAGAAGILLSSVWNYSMSTFFTWNGPSVASRQTAPDSGRIAAAVVSEPCEVER
jgi:dolichol-phosphate mannosyltransferase